MTRLSRVALAALGIIGVLATIVAVGRFDDDAVRRREAARNEGAAFIGAQVVAEIQESITAAQRFGLVTIAEWPETAEYEEIWASFAPSLPGDSTAAVVFEIATEDVAAFEQAERAITPGFTVERFDSADPGYALVVARSASPEMAIGSDLAGQPGLSERLMMVPATALRVFESDFRTEGTSQNQLQLVRRLVSDGPDGLRRDAWSIVQIDLTPAFTNALESAGPGFGARFAIEGFENDASVGLEEALGDGVVRRDEVVGPVELTIDVWSDDRNVQTVSRVGVVAAGLTITLVVMLLASLASSMLANRRRARVDARDARHDHLTGLPNRRWVNEHLRELNGQPVAVLFCDLDRFKVVNDSAGHAAGDEILVEVSKRMCAALDDHTKIARFGGDEFLLVCSGVDDVESHAKKVAAEIREVVAAPFAIDTSEFRTSLSVGIASTQHMVASDGNELVRAADVALGLCKQRGRNGVVTYDDRLRAAELDRLELERDLQQALDDGDMVVYYQPLVGLDREIVSYEALVRWFRNGDVVSPADFLPVVEEIGRMCDLGEVVLRQAVAQFAAGVAPGSAVTLHVNVDAAQLVVPAFPGMVESVLQEHGLQPERLILELTEGEWGESIEEILPVLDELATLGVRFAIDDFGTGNSGMGRTLAVNGLAEIKLDRSMVNQLFDHRNRTFFSGFTSTVRELGIEVIAEGIETEEDMRCAAATGIDRFQGYLFARPAPASDIDFAAESTGGPFVAEPLLRAS